MEFIRKERVKRGLTQTVFGKKIGFSARQIAYYETGFYSIRAIHTLEKFLQALGYELRIHKRTKDEPKRLVEEDCEKIPQDGKG